MTPRGVRNFNPGNIRHSSTVWQGQAASQTDPDFVQFVSSEFGIRAIVKILRSYKAAGIRTIAGAIARWAPSTENDTAAYVTAVCAQCGVGPADIVDLEVLMPILVRAIIQRENGEQPYTDAEINAGIALAGVVTVTEIPTVQPMTPIPVNDPPKAGLVPSNSSVGSGIGGAASIVVIWAIGALGHVTVPPEVAAAIAVLAAVGVGYIPSSGRR